MTHNAPRLQAEGAMSNATTDEESVDRWVVKQCRSIQARVGLSAGDVLDIIHFWERGHISVLSRIAARTADSKVTRVLLQWERAMAIRLTPEGG